MRLRELEIWRAEHDKWAGERARDMDGEIERFEGMEVRLRLVELWKEQQAALVPVRDETVHSVKLNVASIRDEFAEDIKAIDGKVRTMQVRLMLMWGAAIFFATLAAYVVGGMALRRLLGIASVPPPLP